MARVLNSSTAGGTEYLPMAVGRKYSGYYEELKDNVKKRYNEKLNIIGEAVDDPYTFSSGLGIDVTISRIPTSTIS